MELLFDPFNPSDPSKFFPPTTMRFAPMREKVTGRKATIGHRVVESTTTRKEPSILETIGYKEIQDSVSHSMKWEQMICQISNNSSQLFKLNSDICLYPGCQLINNRKNWQASTYQSADIVVLSREDEGVEISCTQAKREVGMDELQIRNTSSRKDSVKVNVTVYDEDENESVDKYWVVKSKLGNLGSNLKRCIRSGKSIIILKSVVPGHFTQTIYFPHENRVEFFDSHGYEGDLGSTDRETKLQLSKLGKKSICDLIDDPDNLVLCKALRTWLPGVIFDVVRLKDLQILDEDAHCQSWSFLYVYLRFIYPRFSKKECEIFLNSLSPRKLYELVLGWWNYILYFPVERINASFIRKYNRMIDSLPTLKNTSWIRKQMRGGNVNRWEIKNNKLLYI